LLLRPAKFEAKNIFQTNSFLKLHFMKRFQIAGNLLKSLLLVGMLTACNNDQMVNPGETAGVQVNDRNAKFSSLTRLVKEGDNTIQYVKSGQFFGKISKVDYSSTNYRFEYTYDNNNPAGDLWISKKQYYKPTNSFVQEWKYKISNGICVTSEAVALGYSFEYKYNLQGLLEEVQMIVQGNVSATWKYTYTYNAVTNAYRLGKIVTASTKFGPGNEYTFTYNSTPDIYSLNFEYANIDKYLPVFGKFSDVLVEKMVEKSLQSPANPSQNYNYTYSTDNDGLVTAQTTQKTFGNNPPSGSGYTVIRKYSSNWQGIP
jgi:hypothetical protein